MPKVEFIVNGKKVSAAYGPGMHVLEMLGEECGIISAKNGCAPEGTCGCCLVLVGGRPAVSCLRRPEQLAGHEVTTLEGVPEEMRRVLGEAFVLGGGGQWGFCQPGIVVRASSWLQNGQASSRESIAKALDGHLCRCTGCTRISDAIQTAGEAWTDHREIARSEPRHHFYFGDEFGLKRNPVGLPKGNGKNGIGSSASRLGGKGQALGDKPFVDDMRVPGMLHGGMVLTPYPRAKVLRIDSSAALAMPGVVRVFTAADVPGQRGTGMVVPDLPIFVAARETTCCLGDFIAMVVADTQFHARKAADQVKVDYEVLPPLTDPFAALEPAAPHVHPQGNMYMQGNLIDTTGFSRGDVETAFATAAHVIEAKFQTQPVEPAFLEPEACLVLPQGKGVEVHTQSQGSSSDQQQIAKILNLPLEEVEIALAASGGGFGAKEELSIQGQTALAAYLLQRPVKTVLR